MCWLESLWGPCCNEVNWCGRAQYLVEVFLLLLDFGNVEQQAPHLPSELQGNSLIDPPGQLEGNKQQEVFVRKGLQRGASVFTSDTLSTFRAEQRGRFYSDRPFIKRQIGWDRMVLSRPQKHSIKDFTKKEMFLKASPVEVLLSGWKKMSLTFCWVVYLQYHKCFQTREICDIIRASFSCLSLYSAVGNIKWCVKE